MNIQDNIKAHTLGPSEISGCHSFKSISSSRVPAVCVCVCVCVCVRGVRGGITCEAVQY